ncbi:MAG: hypothetical protein R2764_08380 [Bacteroidales bacterium]
MKSYKEFTFKIEETSFLNFENIKIGLVLNRKDFITIEENIIGDQFVIKKENLKT